MRSIIIAIMLVAAVATNAHAEYVRGYMRSNGSYVEPHYQTAPNNTQYDNYSTRGNVNPYTGQQGYVQPTYGYQAPIAPPPVPYYQSQYR